ncbi:hypothetical protein FEQ05_01480 [Burkholderia pseudomultivorans]|uniref:Uncharacterized protein n=1 Tax=Burkholderia pseudomultivorans TaxID=1207504 RepID=A0A6P2RB08_9BURK|nr:hypothetical protein [Burkholderia pseudomultivorans]MDR8732848.1 hypothetical protein [Burkholderia pseudomultivorans]MDR8739714.1 hypothetical protein [Burkholderia pseudomultivorans]MDR8752568.1 hypothetical protein [Burkholderia pseudomultivorans]MDR8775820.1 hypothetical protein [Burkholderia pseudomultivorans]
MVQTDPFDAVGCLGIGFTYPVCPAQPTLIALNQQRVPAKRTQLAGFAQSTQSVVWHGRVAALHVIAGFAGHFGRDLRQPSNYSSAVL